MITFRSVYTQHSTAITPKQHTDIPNTRFSAIETTSPRQDFLPQKRIGEPIYDKLF